MSCSLQRPVQKRTRLGAQIEKGQCGEVALASYEEMGSGFGFNGAEGELEVQPAEFGLGFRTTAHAGEAAGAASVWGAVRALRVDRIGHATRAVEDPELVKHLAARRIPLELCPLSNVRTGAIKSVEAHPLRQYFDAGIPVSLNTDDPLFFGNSLAMELESAQRAHRFTRDEIRSLMLSSIEATWLSADRKKQLAADFQRDPSWNEAGV